MVLVYNMTNFFKLWFFLSLTYIYIYIISYLKSLLIVQFSGINCIDNVVQPSSLFSKLVYYLRVF